VLPLLTARSPFHTLDPQYYLYQQPAHLVATPVVGYQGHVSLPTGGRGDVESVVCERSGSTDTVQRGGRSAKGDCSVVVVAVCVVRMATAAVQVGVDSFLRSGSVPAVNGVSVQ
jgi:hypothetical protein